MERRGEQSGRGDRNRETEQANDRIEALLDEREALDELIEEAGQEQEAQAGADRRPPEAEELPSTYWQDRLAAERVSGEAGTPPAVIDSDPAQQEAEARVTEPPEAMPQGVAAEEHQAAQSAFADPVMIAASEQINRQGEVKLKGFASLVEYAIEISHEVATIAHKAADFVKDTWRNLVNRDDHEPER
ncbi:MAG: hypothetical protein PHF37_06460 [Phycisphaerae bacterium]|nr:hypothetical protein [Phycisphaerae bacterium]